MDKLCEYCGAILVRKRYTNNRLEEKKKFAQRMHCDRKCANIHSKQTRINTLPLSTYINNITADIDDFIDYNESLRSDFQISSFELEHFIRNHKEKE